METIVKKTTELTEAEMQGMLDCFIEVFEHERTMEEMCNQYYNTPMGYSIHAMCYDEDRLVAAHTAFPSYYWVGDKRVKAYFAGDTMVKKGYRDGFVFLDLISSLGMYLEQNGYAFSFGFPNEKAYPVYKKVKLAKDVGRLDTYILPYRIGGIKKGFSCFNPLSRLFCRLWLWCNGIGAKEELFKPAIHKDDESYNQSRYKRMDGIYQHVKTDEVEFYYKIKNHEGVRTAFLIDVIGKSEKRLWQAVKYIMRTNKREFDLLMYVGHLPDNIKKTGMIKIPRKYEPKHIYMTGTLVDKNVIDANDFYNVLNWDVNLSNYDLI